MVGRVFVLVVVRSSNLQLDQLMLGTLLSVPHDLQPPAPHETTDMASVVPHDVIQK